MTLMVSSPSGQFIDLQTWQPPPGREDLRLSSSNLPFVQKPRGVAGALVRYTLILGGKAARLFL